MSFNKDDKTVSAKFPISTNVFNNKDFTVAIDGEAGIRLGIVMQNVNSEYLETFKAEPYLVKAEG